MEQRDGVNGPPAPSNAPPRPIGNPHGWEVVCLMCKCPQSGDKRCHFNCACHEPAAPPVAEGPAATPRPLTRETIAEYVRGFYLYKGGQVAEEPTKCQWNDAISTVVSDILDRDANGDFSRDFDKPATHKRWPTIRNKREAEALRAAPPVAEGPAATPRQQAVSSWGFSENIVVLPDEEPAAAPPEARAAARKWLDENFQPHSQSGDYLRRDATDSTEYATWDLMAEYAADLQRQLDEARREREAQDKVWQIRLKGWRDDLQCAEAANQEARRGAQKALLPIAALVQSGACVNAPTELTENIKLAILDAHDTLCALLGPQHGDTK